MSNLAWHFWPFMHSGYFCPVKLLISSEGTSAQRYRLCTINLFLCSKAQSVQWSHICALKLPLPRYKVHGAYMGPIWGRQDPGGPHVGPMNFAIRVYSGAPWSTTSLSTKKNTEYRKISHGISSTWFWQDLLAAVNMYLCYKRILCKFYGQHAGLTRSYTQSLVWIIHKSCVKTLWLKQNGENYVNNKFKCILMKICIFWLKFLRVWLTILSNL